MHNLAVLIFGQLSIRIAPAAASVELAEAMNVVFGVMPRIVIASLIAYVVAQSFDIWFYHYLRDVTKEKVRIPAATAMAIRSRVATTGLMARLRLSGIYGIMSAHLGD